LIITESVALNLCGLFVYHDIVYAGVACPHRLHPGGNGMGRGMPGMGAGPQAAGEATTGAPGLAENGAGEAWRVVAPNAVALGAGKPYTL
jgi:hypothetical protein